MIDQQTINQIFETADIVEVISDFVTLKKSGTNYKGLSPFTNEKTPSFMVSPAKGIFKDFSSGKGGNVVGFLMEHEKITYPEALRYLAGKYHIEINEKEESAEDIQQRNERESLLVVSEFARKYFSDQLLTAAGKAIGMSYFRERGFRDDIIDEFQLGYSPEDRDALTSAARKAGYKTEYLVKTGLSIEKEGRYFDRFSGRVIFPIHSLSGNVIGFGGRTLKTDKNIAKYLNSPESEIYHKSRILYGLFQARKEIVNKNNCFLVEGYTDVLSMHQSGIRNVVASSGTALTTEQIRLIKRFTNNITILYDGDEAGIRASFRGIDMILEEGLDVKGLLLPDGEDPDSFARHHSSSEFLEFIAANQKDFISFKTDLLLSEAENDPIKKAQLISDIVRSISYIPDGIKRSVFLKECSNMLEVEERVLYTEVNKIRRKRMEQSWGKTPPVPAQTVVPEQPVVPAFVQDIYSENEERELISFLLRFGNKVIRLDDDHHSEIGVAQFIIREIQNDELEFRNLVYKKVFEDILSLTEAGKPIEERYFVYHEDEKVRDLAVEILTQRYELSRVWHRKESYVELPGENLEQEVPKSLLSYKLAVVSLARSKMDQELLHAQKKMDNEELNHLLLQIQNLNQVKKLLTDGLGGRIILPNQKHF
ncbi:MAG: DNA primase [Bacteroidota bacterium]